MAASRLADPEFLKQVADLFAAGASRADMCAALNVKDKDTISKWRRDPRVKAATFKIIEDRVLEVTRKVDSIIAGRLSQADQLTIKDLLAIRSEFLGGALRAQTEKADEVTINEAQDWIEKNPDMVELMDKMFSGEVKIPGALEPDAVEA